jgi:polysaccharide deacetylase 2 family uncharacterized protein YibQ
MRGDPFGGEPHALVAIEKPPQPAAPMLKKQDGEAPPTSAEPSASDGVSVETAAEVETQSGVKIVRSRGAAAPGALILDVPQALAARANAAADRRLIEMSRYGPLPRIGPDGARPSDVYARPIVIAADKANAPRIALVVGGMGLSDSLTATAVTGLPAAVTLAFAPYGNDLKSAAARAREAGHEIVLQLPMEPIDYPHVNPGPHALITSKDPAETIDDLHWLLSRFTGYVGVGNFLGAKFTANETAMTPVLREIAARGLLYFDDGSSPRSIACARAGEFNLTAIKADIVLDAVARPDAIDAALKKLESLAISKGMAIGAASGLPVSIDRIARFAREADSHGLVLVPLSAARNLSKVSEEASVPEMPH